MGMGKLEAGRDDYRHSELNDGEPADKLGNRIGIDDRRSGLTTTTKWFMD